MKNVSLLIKGIQIGIIIIVINLYIKINLKFILTLADIGLPEENPKPKPNYITLVHEFYKYSVLD